MKTSLAIVLAAAALMVGVTVDAAIAGYSNKDFATAFSIPDQAPIPSRPGPGPYRGNR